ncbi:TIM-barrel domain-containing protein [Faecalicatena contorta]|uniref:Alpha-glucosidase, glycosyl hydrolase family GH31 n=1 Tax=Faecalicatena contorta TaxID=39482 RepID=A0A315ZYU2_9FIRM|nr:TIM-barrel domain-containing protein [Faecalicatena contorta]PWJ50483.1 alpha-glucosidase (family GH31 glycosyl hydrolase) [Faecalicatena contorta]SUQ13891.1 Alpha-glucosidase, glycosyl hydrolase family GH31 [Faecalicatena contorta]
MNQQNKNMRWLDIYRRCVSGDLSGVKEELHDMFTLEKHSYHEMCVLLFLAAEYHRLASETDFLATYKLQMKQMQKKILSVWKEKQSSFWDEKEDFYAANVGLAYGSLYNSNLFLKEDAVAQTLGEMKNYVYTHYTSGGKLVDVKGGLTVSTELLFICVPFGLFTPEDLVLVAAVGEMKVETPEQKAMLAWYFAEKSDYKHAKIFLDEISDAVGIAAAIGKIVRFKLAAAGVLADKPIMHVPFGNSNRYQSQNYERTPWQPKEGERVVLYAAAWPVRYPEPIYVAYQTGSGNEIKMVGNFEEDTENYRFDLGTFKGGEKVSYYFTTKDYRSECYELVILQKERIQNVRHIYENEKQIIVELTSDQGKTYTAHVTDREGQWELHLEETDNPTITDYSIKADGHMKVFASDEACFQVELLDVKITIKEIYVWRDNQGIVSTGMQIAARKQERFYGFGERYNHINQRGNLVDVYVYNQYKDQGIRTYFPMPYFLSSEKYGLYVDTKCYTEFDMCKSNEKFYTIEVQEAMIKLHCFVGLPKDIIGKFSTLTGRPEPLPDWAFGPWMSSNNWDSETEVRKQVELTKQHDIPATVLVIEAWSDEATYYAFNDAVYTENNGAKALQYQDYIFPKWGRWPDPKGLVGYLHENGLACILWQIPIIKYINSLHHLQKDYDESYAIRQGYVAVSPDRNAYRMPEGWFTGSLLFDFTNEEAVRWWFDKREYLVTDVGIDGFKTDGGEFVFGDDICFADGSTGKEMRNEYPNSYISAYYRYIKEKRGGIVFSRAGYTGAAKMPAHWAGDERSTFEAFSRNLCAGLNAGISGVPFWGWDLGGFSGEIPSAELYIRSTQMAAFCPIMQYHAESKAQFNQDRTPWNIAKRQNAPWVIEDYRYYAKLRMALLPYIIEQAEKSVQSGIPMMRALFIEFPEDESTWDIFDQYMFGDDLLVAPVISEGATFRRVYVPRGEWIHLFTGEVFKGGQLYDVKADVHEIIVLRKADSVWDFVIEKEDFQICRREK